jgi:broad specificity phosphatase PhoE
MSPGGESTVDFDRRVRRAMSALITRSQGKTVLVVTHGGFISAACLFMLGAPGLYEERPAFLDPANTSITQFSRNEPGRRWTLNRYNDSSYLESSHVDTAIPGEALAD